MNATLAIRAEDSATPLPSVPEYAARPSPRRRAASFALAVAIEILLILAFFTLDFDDKKKPEFEGGRITTFDISADSQQEATRSVQKDQQVTPNPRTPRPMPPIPKPTVEIPERPLQMIEVSREVFIASDIAKLGTKAPDGPRLAEGGAPAGSAPGDSARVGTAPNGEPLYAAEWYREPTHAELGGYLPKRMPEGGGWGMVACRTAPRFRVEDCVELGQGPAGSHLAGAVRQAAWQFLVRPPRVGGKAMVGEWVRIRITYSTSRSDNELR